MFPTLLVKLNKQDHRESWNLATCEGHSSEFSDVLQIFFVDSLGYKNLEFSDNNTIKQTAATQSWIKYQYCKHEIISYESYSYHNFVI